MSDNVTLSIPAEPLQKLIQVMSEYVVLTGKDAAKALQKAGREVDFAMFQEMREQPPRPVKGSITSAAKARGYHVATNSDSYVTGYQQALAILGGYKSGFFRITDRAGVTTADLVSAGPARKTYQAGPGGRAAGSRLVSGAPAGTVQLNLGALATLLALKQREKAAAGGYMSAEFLTFRAFDKSSASGATYVTKDRKTVGALNKSDERITITGFVEHASAIATKYGITGKAINRGADSYRSDMLTYVTNRAKTVIEKLGNS